MSRRLFPPDDPDKPFIARWNMLTRILLVETSVKYVARAAMDFADFGDGTSCFPSNDRIGRETGLSARTVQDAWAVMRGLRMAVRVARGVPHRRLADEYQLEIPDGWRNLPVLGPHARDFNCLRCGKLFTPHAHSILPKGEDRDDPGVKFQVAKMVFCPEPRRTRGRDATSCQDGWNREQVAAGGQPWHKIGAECWKWFRRARGDDW